MKDVRFCFAAAEEESKIRDLLSAAGLPSDDIGNHLHHFILAKRDDNLAGCIGLELSAPMALLRSLVVNVEDRNQGIAEKLCERLTEYAKMHRVQELYLLTTTAADYFERRGFVRIAREDAPPAIQQSKQFTSLCPSTAICMRKRI